MELPSKFLEQLAFNLRPKMEEHLLIVMDKSTQEENLAQPLQTNNKQFKIAINFLTGYNEIFKVTNSNNEFFFPKLFFDEAGFIQTTIAPGAYEIESSNIEIKRILTNGGQFTEADYPFTIKPNCSTLGGIIEISKQGPLIRFQLDDCLGNLLGFNAVRLYGEYNLSPNSVDILSFDSSLFQCDIAQRMVFRGKRRRIFHNFTMDVDPGYKYIEKIIGAIQLYLMGSKDFFSSISFILKNENNQLVSFSGQSITFRISIKEI